jgi:N-acetylglutamate synthase-like GNAT family acetyltransferase
MLIRKADYENLEDILSLQKICYVSEAEIINNYAIQPLTQKLSEIQKEFETNVILKAVENGQIIGSVRAYEQDGTCLIGKVIVRPDWQNKGIGGKLLSSIEKEFGHCRRYELFTGLKSEKNIHLYEKNGYKIFKTEKIDDTLSFVFLEKSN